MTEGNPKLLVRVSREMRDQIKEAIRRRNLRSRDEPWDMSAFIRVAIRDKLHHMERSRGRKRRTKNTENAASNEGSECAA